MVSTHSAGFSLNLKNQVLLVHGNLMENRGLVWKKETKGILHLEVQKGGSGQLTALFVVLILQQQE